MDGGCKFIPFPAPQFSELHPRKRGYLDRERYEQARAEFLSENGKNYHFERLVYPSDGLQVSGFLVRPAEASPSPRPWILFNRGGNGELGSIDVTFAATFKKYVDAGYVVVGSQYRGADGGQGRDEFGGRDVQDVLNLVSVVREWPFIQPDHFYAMGISRGGMMTLLALKQGLAPKAAAVVASVTDFWKEAAHRVEMEKYVFRELIPDFPRRREESFRDRSASCWAEKLSTPLLILHGKDDKNVHCSQAEILAERLQRYGHEVRLRLVEGGNHGLTNQKELRDQEILDWFAEHAAVAAEEFSSRSLGNKIAGRELAPYS